MYFTIGGRKTQSGLYRVTYTGAESTAAVGNALRGVPDAAADARAARRSSKHSTASKTQAAIDAAWPHLSSPDRYIRSAARVALEHQDPSRLAGQGAGRETSPAASTQALLALVRVSGSDPSHRPPSTPPADEALRSARFSPPSAGSTGRS